VNKKVTFIYLMVKKQNSPIMDWRGGFLVLGAWETINGDVAVMMTLVR
jgi:hypothetical protein